jgi:hypothetical protein
VKTSNARGRTLNYRARTITGCLCFLAMGCVSPSLDQLSNAKSQELSAMFPVGISLEEAEAKLVASHLPKSVVRNCNLGGAGGTCVWTSAEVTKPFSFCVATNELGLIFDESDRLVSHKAHGLNTCFWPFSW